MRVLTRIEPESRRSDADRATLEREVELGRSASQAGIRTAEKLIGCARTLWDYAVGQGYARRNIAARVKKAAAERPIESDFEEANTSSRRKRSP